jgi:hypothetical protein
MDLTDDSHLNTLTSGLILSEAAAVYPVSAATMPTDDHLFVPSMATPQYAQDETLKGMKVDPNGKFPVGKSFGMTIGAYHITADDATDGKVPRTLRRAFEEAYFEQEGADSLNVAGMVKLAEDLLVVAGHTRSKGRRVRKELLDR